jgi:hypothetical protein
MTAGGRFLTRGLNRVKAETALSVLAYNISIWLAHRVLGPVSTDPTIKSGSPEPLVSTQPGVPGLPAGVIRGLRLVAICARLYLSNSLHDWHFEILFIVAIIRQLTHIVLEAR